MSTIRVMAQGPFRVEPSSTANARQSTRRPGRAGRAGVLATPPNPTARWMTVLIAEVVDSARLFGTYPDTAIARWERCVEAVRRLAAASPAARGVMVAGDEFLVAFDNAGDAVRLALAVRHAVRSLNDGVPRDAALRLRTGLASGPVTQRANDWLGPPVDRARDLELAALGDELLVDPSLRYCLCNAADYRLHAAGERPLRGGRLAPAYRLEDYGALCGVPQSARSEAGRQRPQELIA